MSVFEHRRHCWEGTIFAMVFLVLENAAAISGSGCVRCVIWGLVFGV